MRHTTDLDSGLRRNDTAFLNAPRVPPHHGSSLGDLAACSIFLFIVITRLVRVIHLSANAEAWIARASRAMTAELSLGEHAKVPQVKTSPWRGNERGPPARSSGLSILSPCQNSVASSVHHPEHGRRCSDRRPDASRGSGGRALLRDAQTDQRAGGLRSPAGVAMLPSDQGPAPRGKLRLIFIYSRGESGLGVRPSTRQPQHRRRFRAP